MFAQMEDAIIVRHAKYGDKYCAYVIIQKQVGMYNFINLYFSGESQNYKNKSKSEILKGNAGKLKKDLDSRAKNGDDVGFTLMGLGIAKARAAILKPSQQSLNEEKDYYATINGVIIHVIQELKNLTFDNTEEIKVQTRSFNELRQEPSSQNQNYNNIQNSKKNSTNVNTTTSQVNSNVDYRQGDKSESSNDITIRDILELILGLLMYIAAGVYGYSYTTVGGIGGVVACWIFLTLILGVPILDFILVAIIGYAIAGSSGLIVGWIGLVIIKYKLIRD